MSDLPPTHAVRRAVILAGGLGTRLSEETVVRPKPMVEIGGRPILWHIMKCYAAHGIREFVICLGYRGYMIKEFFANYHRHTADLTIDLAQGVVEVRRAPVEPWRVTLVETGEATMTGGRLRRVAAYLMGEPFCMTYGDAVSTVDIAAAIRFHQAHGGLATVTAVRPPARFGALRMEGDRVVAFQEKPQAGAGLINGGFFVLQPQVLDLIAGDETVWEHEPMEYLAACGQLHGFRHEGFWQPMDTLREKRLLDSLWASGEAPWSRGWTQ